LSPGEAIGDDSMPMTVDVRSDAAVYAAHATEMVRFATGLVGPSDAPDVVADAFVRLSAAPVWAAALDRRALWYRAVLFEARSFQRSTARRRDREVRVAVGDRVSVHEPEPLVEALDASGRVTGSLAVDVPGNPKANYRFENVSGTADGISVEESAK
jgi:DNA-directed RNA polymerase specialized sigma24 family protein